MLKAKRQTIRNIHEPESKRYGKKYRIGFNGGGFVDYGQNA
jgi:hypothetical protein